MRIDKDMANNMNYTHVILIVSKKYNCAEKMDDTVYNDVNCDRK